MFTIRVDEMPTRSRSVYACRSYSVLWGAGDVRLVLQEDPPVESGLVAGGSTPLPTQQREVSLSGGSIAYVMNSQGTTVDIIRTNARRMP